MNKILTLLTWKWHGKALRTSTLMPPPALPQLSDYLPLAVPGFR